MSELPDTLSIDTPENVTFSHETAGIGSRFLAALIDTLLIGVLQLIVIGTILLILSQLSSLLQTDSLASQPEDPALFWVLGILFFLSFVFFWGYYIYFEIFWNGQTPGKRWIGLRVIRVDGTPVSFSEVLIRNLVRTLDLLPAAYGVGVVTMFINRNSRRLGDLAAGTVVVRDLLVSPSELTLHERGGVAAARTVDGPLPAGFPLQKMEDQDLQVIESFLNRRDRLANRDRLALYIALSVCARLGYALDPSFAQDPERFLVLIHSAAQNLKSR